MGIKMQIKMQIQVIIAALYAGKVALKDTRYKSGLILILLQVASATTHTLTFQTKDT